MDWSPVSEMEVTKVLRMILHWKAPGRDQIANFWLQQLTEIHTCEAVPLQAWSAPDSSRKLRFPDFMTTAQDGGNVVSLKHWPPLPPGNTPGTHFC
jgi:hypothetical protein